MATTTFCTHPHGTTWTKSDTTQTTIILTLLGTTKHAHFSGGEALPKVSHLSPVYGEA